MAADGDKVPGAAVITTTSAGRSPGLSAATSVAEEWAEWLGRVRATYQAVCYTCAHRLVSPALAEQVAVQVTAGLLARPGVFRYFGLPYSGRIARLAEARIAEADEGRLAMVCGWPELYGRLARVPAEHQEVLVVTCVRGGGVESLAAALVCDHATAERRNQAMLAFMRELARPALARAAEPDGGE